MARPSAPTRARRRAQRWRYSRKKAARGDARSQSDAVGRLELRYETAPISSLKALAAGTNEVGELTAATTTAARQCAKDEPGKREEEEPWADVVVGKIGQDRRPPPCRGDG